MMMQKKGKIFTIVSLFLLFYMLALTGCSSEKEGNIIGHKDKEGVMAKQIRHLRGTWVATVLNLDWPSQSSLALDQELRISKQKSELLAILDEAVDMKINAVFFQVKPNADAFYKSSILPWSSNLTGHLGQDPGYDPLQFAITEAHKRNLELHAWFNPYRVSMNTKQSTIDELKNTPAGSPKSVYVTHPDWIGTASERFVVNPGVPEAQDWVKKVVMEVAKEYDVDGVHFDDYFYYESPNSKLDDDGTFREYGGDFTDKGDWRRNNTLTLISELSKELRTFKPEIKFGISPSGVWHNKSDDPLGSDTKGNPHYDNQYADTRKWIIDELIDYIAPQIYWPFTRKIVSFGVLTDWWSEVVKNKNVHLYIGEALYKVGVLSKTEPEWLVDNGVKEITDQLLWNIAKPEIEGSILFRYSDLNREAVLPAKAAIQDKVWPDPALIPSMPWKGTTAPQAPINLTKSAQDNKVKLQWQDGDQDSKKTIYYAIYKFIDDKPDITDGTMLTTVRRVESSQQVWVGNTEDDSAALYGVTALDHNHNESDLCVPN